MLINNGGGIFDPDGKVDVVTDRNLETVNFIAELAKAGAIDPAAVSYTTDNLQTQWKSNKIAIGVYNAGSAGGPRGHLWRPTRDEPADRTAR